MIARWSQAQGEERKSPYQWGLADFVLDVNVNIGLLAEKLPNAVAVLCTDERKQIHAPRQSAGTAGFPRRFAGLLLARAPLGGAAARFTY